MGFLQGSVPGLVPAIDSGIMAAAAIGIRATNMASFNTNEFRSGLKIIIDNDPCVIVENEFVKPGKGQA